MAKAECITKPNLLLNGDFQCNQRGKTSYTNYQNVRIYGLDMWASYVDNSVMVGYYPIDGGGIRIQGEGISSRLLQEPPHIKDGKNHMLMLDISISKQEGTIQFGIYDGSNFVLKDVKNGLNVFDLGTTDIERVCIFTAGNIDVICNYIYLYEGDTEIEHQKEDYSIALIRCKKHIIVVSFTLMHFIYDKNYPIIVPYLLLVPMVASPSVDLLSKNTEGNVSQVTLTMLEHRDTLLLTVAPITAGNMAIYDYRYLVSCEKA